MGTLLRRSHRVPLNGALLLLLLAWIVPFQAACKAKAPAPGEAPAASKPPNLLLITVDTLRPDALGWVSGSNETPAIDRLAREGFRFPAAVAPVPLTLPSHISIMTGLLPRRAGVRDNGQVLQTGPATLAESLRKRGYATAAFVSGYPVDSLFGLDRGFDLYDDRFPVGSEGELERPASATTASALTWLRTARPPWFAWIHYYDPHYPYEPESSFRRSGWRGAYDGEVAFVDHSIAELREGLAPLGAGETLTVFAADHGESLGEHGEGTHGFFIYDSTVLVPLVVHFPGRIEPGSSLAPARLLDVAPTVLELFGQPPLVRIDGVSLLPTLLGRQQEIPPAYIETYQPWTSYGWSPLKAVRHGGWKLIVSPRPELYHLEEDPGEERNLLDQNREQARKLLEFARQAETVPGVGAQEAGDPEVLSRLRSLGYLGGGHASEPPRHGLRDPKDCRELRDLLTQADEVLRRGKYRAAVARFDAVLKQDPNNRFATLRSGFALSRIGDLQSALERLRRAVQLDPDQPEARSTLAEALTRARHHNSAAEQWMEAIRLQPRRAEAWSNLGTALGLAGKVNEAVNAFARAVELEPRNTGFLAKLAFAEHAAGRIAAAVDHLRQVAELSGKESFPYSGALGILLAQLGERGEARVWLARSRPGEGDFAEGRMQLAILEAERNDREAARRALREALSAGPHLRARAKADPRLAPLLP